MVEQHRNPENNEGKEEVGGSGLKHIGEILSRGQERPDGRSSGTTRESHQMKETKTEDCVCQSCGQTFRGEVTIFYYTNPPREFRNTECPKCREARESEEKIIEDQELELRRILVRERWKRECGIPWGLQCTRFEDFEPEYERKPLRACLKWAENINIENPKGTPSLLLFSEVPGVGKTTLMACIANYIINNWHGDPDQARCPIRFESGPGLVRRIRATYNIPDDDAHLEREEQVYNQLRGVNLLMLDDVGKEQPHSNRFTQEVYWYINDERVKASLPMVISSRLEMTGPGSLEELMTADAVDRLYGMCRGQIVTLGGNSYRRSHNIP